MYTDDVFNFFVTIAALAVQCQLQPFFMVMLIHSTWLTLEKKVLFLPKYCKSQK